MTPQQDETQPAQAPSSRLVTIDYMKGLSMMMIFYGHIGWTWRASSWISFSRLQWVLLDFFGPAMFVTLSVVGSMLSLQKKNAGDAGPLFPGRTLVKVSFVLAFGEVINAINGWHMGAYHLIGWNVITFIALFSYLFLPALLRSKARYRLLAIAAVVLLYYPLLLWANTGLVDAGITPFTITLADAADPRVAAYQLLFHQVAMTPILPWVILPLLTSLAFEGLSRSFNEHSEERTRAELSKILRIGLACIAIGILSGLVLWRGIDQSAYQDMMHDDPYQFWPFDAGVPLFWIRHTPQYIFLMFGLICVLFSVFGNMERSGGRFPSKERVTNFGELSLTAYLLSHVGYAIPIKLDFGIFLPALVGIIALFVELLWQWTRRGKRVGTLEWLMVVYTGLVMRAASRYKRDAALSS